MNGFHKHRQSGMNSKRKSIIFVLFFAKLKNSQKPIIMQHWKQMSYGFIGYVPHFSMIIRRSPVSSAKNGTWWKNHHFTKLPYRDTLDMNLCIVGFALFFHFFQFSIRKNIWILLLARFCLLITHALRINFEIFSFAFFIFFVDVDRRHL